MNGLSFFVFLDSTAIQAEQRWIGIIALTFVTTQTMPSKRE
jgi:hypothetical protein